MDDGDRCLHALFGIDDATGAEHEKSELADGHMPAIEVMEIVREDGSVYYEAVTGPNCFHKCAACRGEIDEEASEFGTGAIGVFADSSGGEMERLRKEMRALAATFTQAVSNLQGGLPAATEPAPALPETSTPDEE